MKMEQKFFYNVVVPILVLLLIATCTSCSDKDNTLYRNYYNATETLIDEIDYDYQWSANVDFCAEDYSSTIAYKYFEILADIENGKEDYKKYYTISEKLLDYLDEEYGWMDTTSGGDAYCKYCEAYSVINKQDGK